MNCRNCGTATIIFFSMGKLPLGNGFLKKEEIPLEETHDLTAGFCPRCYLVQLVKTVPDERLYRTMFYLPSSFESKLRESKEIVSHLVKRLSLTHQSLVVDIGSSDGYQLQFFKERGMQVLGIEPALNVAAAAIQKGIPTRMDFFNFRLAEQLRKDLKREATLILSSDLLNHIADIRDFLRGVKLLLEPNGTAFFKFIMQREFDVINHEHVTYFSFLSLNNVLRNEGLEMYDAEIKKTTLRILISHCGTFPATENVRRFRDQELQEGFDKLETYQKLGQNVAKNKKELVNLLDRLKKKGKSIAAYSSPEKGNVLLNYCGIGKKYLDFVADQSKLKQGLYTPGTHFLIHAPEKIYRERPDYLLILCWDIAEEIMDQLKDYHDTGGRFIVPAPKIRVI